MNLQASDLKKFRELKGMTQAQLASYFDVGQSFISLMEKGKNPVSKSITRKILDDPDLGAFFANAPSETISINHDEVGVPYYNVDFIGGFDLIANDQTINPAYYINFPLYNKADSWVSVTGYSMAPLINHGDMIAIKKLQDWKENILYGEIYAIVADEYRTVKRIRKSSLGNDFIRLVPINPEFDEQDVPKKTILFVYQVLGCTKRIL